MAHGFKAHVKPRPRKESSFMTSCVYGLIIQLSSFTILSFFSAWHLATRLQPLQWQLPSLLFPLHHSATTGNLFFLLFLVCLLINIRLLFHLFNVFLSCYYLNYDILVLFYPVIYLSKVIICYSLILPFFSIYLLYFIQFKFLEFFIC